MSFYESLKDLSKIDIYRNYYGFESIIITLNLKEQGYLRIYPDYSGMLILNTKSAKFNNILFQYNDGYCYAPPINLKNYYFVYFYKRSAISNITTKQIFEECFNYLPDNVKQFYIFNVDELDEK